MKTREINNKHYIDAKVVMLATDKDSNINLCSYSDTMSFKTDFEKKECCINQNLYITSNEEIKEGDWCHTKWGIDKCDKIGGLGIHYFNGLSMSFGKTELEYNQVKKIIATTDSSLVTNKGEVTEKFRYFYLPQLSKEFIQAYIESHNNGKVIEDVLVEMDERTDFKDVFDAIDGNAYQIKLKDNIITIKKKEEDWDDIFHNYWNEPIRENSGVVLDFKQWFERNYSPPQKK